MSQTSLVINGLFMLGGALLGAPLVAKINNRHSKRKDRKDYRIDRVAEWSRMVQHASDVGTSYGSNNMKTYDFRNTNEYASLESLLQSVEKQSINELMGPYCLLGEEENYWRDLIFGNYLDALTILRREISRIESGWDLL